MHHNPLTIERKVDSLKRIAPVMGELIAEQIDEYRSKFFADSRKSIVRLSIQIPGIDLLEWLFNQRLPARTYWSNRRGDFEMAGVGVADQICDDENTKIEEPISEIERRLQDADPDVRYFGGLRFDSAGSESSDAWKGFGDYRFVLPRFEIVSESNEHWFVCNLKLSDDLNDTETIINLLSEINFSSNSSLTARRPTVKRRDIPDRETWLGMVADALKRCRKGELQKLVLARQIVLDGSNAFDEVNLLRSLKERTSSRFHFCLGSNSTGCLIGASPELLFSRHGREIETEAIAGTRARGQDDRSDIELENDLLSNHKEHDEHQYVVNGIRERLEPLCTTLENNGIHTLKLARVQHLITRFKGYLQTNISNADLLTALHPSPAVGGYPATKAQKPIAEIEPFDRGWYSGPVGWVGHASAEFAVAIRCGLVDGNRLTLFSGAGILEGSLAEQEWEETESKLESMLQIVM